MSKSLNKAMIIGHLGKDPEIRYTGAGTAIASFSIATNESWKDSAGVQQEKTEWHNVVAFGKLAEICQQWLKKGKKIYAEGRLQTSNWEDKNHPEIKHYKTEIVMSSMIMLDGPRTGEIAGDDTTPTPADPGNKPGDDLPF